MITNAYSLDSSSCTFLLLFGSAEKVEALRAAQTDFLRQRGIRVPGEGVSNQVGKFPASSRCIFLNLAVVKSSVYATLFFLIIIECRKQAWYSGRIRGKRHNSWGSGDEAKFKCRGQNFRACRWEGSVRFITVAKIYS